MGNFTGFLFSLILAGACAAESPSGNMPGCEAVNVEGVDNFFRLSPTFYRSEQPNEKGFKNIDKMGIKTILNLREYHTNVDDIKGTKLIPLRYKLAAGNITEGDLMQIMTMISLAQKPVLVHCMHGADRTGAVCAAYRIVEQGWTPEDAIKEMESGPFGFHQRTYSYLPGFLKSINWAEFKAKLHESVKRQKAKKS